MRSQTGALMHRHRAIGRQSPAPVQRQPFEHRLDVLALGVFAEGLKRQALSLVHEVVSRVVIHAASIVRAPRAVHSYFPSLEFLLRRHCAGAGSHRHA